ncbi:MAG: porin family protein [Bradyrhizobium sp.]|uniref:outer membrane protein n=1 Tax=Bradyrhizobium sp. TaxID=376 RepID=UPI001C28AEFC|nr:outer membrane beta-barrel protein [Bradyrhizobium sp.]MBU6464532.1 outer membrane beta-barrel protein [Pseudomonadota bacterium]MDE2067731.1 porin family protein [Bradyrhizobium sp.]MDE2243430.1 porin family protein [Bradyrhizobium sp.]MDE2469831.1 porin family protein [Bradyrhizobium sp.]
MRRFFLLAIVLGAASGAQAADMPDFLRGSLLPSPAPGVNWQGFYVGGQAGYGSSDENFNGSTNNMIAALVANNVIQQTGVANWNLNLGKESSRTTGFGGFTGYNWQWDDVVLGLEASYLHGSFGGMASASEGPLIFGPLSDNAYHAVGATSTSAINITDMATFRGRAAYAYGSFLPYMFGGLALGNANISQSATVTDRYAFTFAGAQSSCSTAGTYCPAPLTSTNALHNHLVYGYTGGLGVDVNLIGGLFMRAEWEYVRFAASTDTSINTVRAGLGYKF